MKFWLRACTKCGGDLELSADLDGPYVACVQCGVELTRVQETLLRRLLQRPAHQSVLGAFASSQPAPQEQAV